jgi:SAM-dependent methyltransferase
MRLSIDLLKEMLPSQSSSAEKRYVEDMHTFDGMLEILDEHSIFPPGGDAGLRAFAEAEILLLVANTKASENYRQVLKDNLLNRQHGHIKPEYAAQLLSRAKIKQAKKPAAKRLGYPKTHMQGEGWWKTHHWIMEDEDRLNEFAEDIRLRRLQANIGQRAVVIPLITAGKNIEDGRFPEGEAVRVLDVGCGQMRCLTILKSQGMLTPVEVVRETAEGMEIDEDGTAAFRSLLDRKFKLGPSVGIDSIDPSDPGVNEWAEANYRPQEDQKGRTKEYVELNRKKFKGVDFHQADITRSEELKSLEHLKGSFDVVYTSNMLYQLGTKEKAAARRNMRGFVSPSGLIIELGFSYIENRQTGPVVKQYPRMYNANYKQRAIVEDTTKSTGPESFGVFENGRCETLLLEAAGLAVRSRLLR